MGDPGESHGHRDFVLSWLSEMHADHHQPERPGQGEQHSLGVDHGHTSGSHGADHVSQDGHDEISPCQRYPPNSYEYSDLASSLGLPVPAAAETHSIRRCREAYGATGPHVSAEGIYERRPRRKTRFDRCDVRSRESRGKHREGRIDGRVPLRPTERVMRNFSSAAVPSNGILLKPNLTTGLFRNGRTSNGRQIEDLAFDDMLFMNRDGANDGRRRHQRLRRKVRRQDNDAWQYPLSTNSRRTALRRYSHGTAPSRTSSSRVHSRSDGNSQLGEFWFKPHNPEYTLRVLLDTGTLGHSAALLQHENNPADAIRNCQDGPKHYVDRGVMVTPGLTRVSRSPMISRQRMEVPSSAPRVENVQRDRARRHTVAPGNHAQSTYSYMHHKSQRSGSQSDPYTLPPQQAPTPGVQAYQRSSAVEKARHPPRESMWQFIRRIEEEVFGRKAGCASQEELGDCIVNRLDPVIRTQEGHSSGPAWLPSPPHQGQMKPVDGYIDMSKFWRPNHLI